MTSHRQILPPSDQLKHWEDLWFSEQENVDVLLIEAFQAGANAAIQRLTAGTQPPPSARSASEQQPRLAPLPAMAIYQFTHYDAFGGKDIQSFDTIDDIREEIDRLEHCLEDRHSWRVQETISQLREFLAEAEAMEEDEE